MKEVHVTNTSAVVLQQVTKRFQNVTAVDAIDLDIRDGEFFSMLGPSGCGKTTTLRMIAGFEFPSSGVISLGGAHVEKVPAHLRNVNTVFQSYALFPHMTVAENIAFGLEMKNVPRADIKPRVDAALAMVQLGNYGARRPKQLSGGQQQRVALARALVNRPKVLLLDEPLGALDLKLRRQMQVELKAIQSEVGLTFLHVTHDQEEAMTMADTVAVMNKGKIEQMGAPAELYELPKTRFVATFLGQSNLFDGKVTGATSETISVAVGSLTLELPAKRSAITSGDITVGVRPEKIAITRAKPAASKSRSLIGPGTVTDASFSGVSTQYLVDVPGLSTMTVFEQNDGDIVKAGTEVWLSWDSEFSFGIPLEAQDFHDSDTSTTTLAAQAK